MSAGDVSQITGPVAAHGEGPVWDSVAGLIRWVDIPAGTVLSLDPALGLPTTAPQVRRVAPIAAAFRPRASGGWVLATGDAFQLLDADWRLEREIPVPMDQGERFNDGGCVPGGAFYCGTQSPTDAGILWRLGADGTVSSELDGLSISNGLSVSPDGTRAYYTDTPTLRLDVFDIVDGRLIDRRPVTEFPAEYGNPDGLTVDAEGGVWVAFWDGAAVRRFDAEGRQTHVIEVPTRRPTSCAFGGADLTTLFITTSARDADPEDPHAGALYSCVPGVVGVPVLAYAG